MRSNAYILCKVSFALQDVCLWAQGYLCLLSKIQKEKLFISDLGSQKGPTHAVGIILIVQVAAQQRV